MELRRILKPGGRMYLTVADEFVVDYYLNSSADDKRYKKDAGSEKLKREAAKMPAGLPEDWQYIAWRDDILEDQVFYHTEYLQSFWGQYVNIIDIARQDEGKQTSVVVSKS